MTEALGRPAAPAASARKRKATRLLSCMERGRDLKSVVIAASSDSKCIFPKKQYLVALGLKQIFVGVPGNPSILSDLSTGKSALNTWIITYP